jgi:hypothetical protein
MKRLAGLSVLCLAAVAAVVGLVCVLPVAGIGAAGRIAGRETPIVRIEVTTYRATVRHVESFSLTCNPTHGSLPLAGRVCADIALHPRAMLDPPKPGPPRQSQFCSGGPFMPQLSVRVTRNGGTRGFGGSPGCNWPGNQALAVYYDASRSDTRDLTESELELRCDEDPVLFQIPTPTASVVACRHGLWTARSEQLIRLAERSPALAPFQPATLFPHDIGVLPCTIHAGGAFPGQRLSGLCGVTMKDIWATATVSLTEDWPSGSRTTARHIWHIVIQGNHVLSTSQSGPAPPQTWP